VLISDYLLLGIWQGLSLFNFDMIREGGSGNRYYIIDINYFPGTWNQFPF
jgi:hypothetical protein